MTRHLIALLVFFANLAFTSPAAHAVYVNPDGRGQALIFPYWTVQAVNDGAFNTYISIMSHNAMRAVRVRVREGREGKEIASFNLFLGGLDTWAGAIVPTDRGASLVTASTNICSDPEFTALGTGLSALDFSPARYTGANDDGRGTDIERIREGYIEVLTMSELDIPEGTPVTCAQLRQGFAATGGLSPVGGISGTFTLINVANGMELSGNPIALASLTRRLGVRPPTDPYPDFDAPEIDATATFVADGTFYRATTASGLAAIEAVLTKGNLYNDYVLDPGTRSATDWIFTFPTRRFRTGANPGTQFGNAYLQGTTDVESGFSFYSRGIVDFGGINNGCNSSCLARQYSANLRLPSASTAWSFRNGGGASAIPGTSDVLGSRNGWIITLPTNQPNGRVELAFGHTGKVGPLLTFDAMTPETSSVIRSYRTGGMPVVGFMVRSFKNGFLNCGGAQCQGNYGGLFMHRYRMGVSASP